MAGRVAARARPGLVAARSPTRVWALASSPASIDLPLRPGPLPVQLLHPRPRLLRSYGPRRLLLSGRTSSSPWPGFTVVRAGVASSVVTRTGVRPTLLNLSSSHIVPSLCAIILFMDHPCDLYLYGCSRRSPAPLANPLFPCPFHPPNCPQQVRVCFVWFALVGLGRCGNYPLSGKPTPLWLDTLAYVHFPPLPYLLLFDVPFHLLHPTHTIVYPNIHYRIDDLTNAGEIRAARRHHPPLRGPTISKSRASSGTPPP